LAQVRQKRGETVAEYIQHFREVKNRCYSTQILEKEPVELASLGLVKPIRDLVFQLEFNSENDGIRATPPRIIPRQVQTSSSNG
jgi:hypothetical protein